MESLLTRFVKNNDKGLWRYLNELITNLILISLYLMTSSSSGQAL